MAGLHLTPDQIEAAYELLRTTPPFRGWKLPHADEVEFHATSIKDSFADFNHFYNRGQPRGRWIMRINQKACGTLGTLIATVAHEMCHLRDAMLGNRLDVEHSARFNKLADQVCRCHHFDRKAF